jgi:hypothetical protein
LNPSVFNVRCYCQLILAGELSQEITTHTCLVLDKSESGLVFQREEKICRMDTQEKFCWSS